MPDIRVDNFAGAPLHYDRFSSAAYGTEGTPFRPYVNPTFAAECEACFKELAALMAPKFGALRIIVSGGVSRQGSGASYHHQNRAFDLDALFFQNVSWVANTFPARRHVYLAIESVIRKHFGTVLAYEYNAAHEDHIHFDNGRAPRFSRMSKTRVTFLQNMIAYVYDIPVGVDGVYGPETDGALKLVQAEFGFGDFADKTEWMKFLDHSGAGALARAH